MRSGFKLALLAIFGVPALYYGLQLAYRGAYRGIVDRRIPMGEEESDAAVGVVAIAIGCYCALMGLLLVFTVGYIAVWLLPD